MSIQLSCPVCRAAASDVVYPLNDRWGTNYDEPTLENALDPRRNDDDGYDSLYRLAPDDGRHTFECACKRAIWIEPRAGESIQTGSYGTWFVLATTQDGLSAAPFARRDPKLRALLDAARDLADYPSAPMMRDALLQLAKEWASEECPTCGRRGDHEWSELTTGEQAAHMA